MRFSRPFPYRRSRHRSKYEFNYACCRSSGDRETKRECCTRAVFAPTDHGKRVRGKRTALLFTTARTILFFDPDFGTTNAREIAFPRPNSLRYNGGRVSLSTVVRKSRFIYSRLARVLLKRHNGLGVSDSRTRRAWERNNKNKKQNKYAVTPPNDRKSSYGRIERDIRTKKIRV